LLDDSKQFRCGFARPVVKRQCNGAPLGVASPSGRTENVASPAPYGPGRPARQSGGY
jgi:hypothetical protein